MAAGIRGLAVEIKGPPAGSRDRVAGVSAGGELKWLILWCHQLMCCHQLMPRQPTTMKQQEHQLRSGVLHVSGKLEGYVIGRQLGGYVVDVDLGGDVVICVCLPCAQEVFTHCRGVEARADLAGTE